MTETSGASAASPPDKKPDPDSLDEVDQRVRRGAMLSALKATTAVVGRLLIIAAAVVGLLYLLSRLWVVVLPLLLALLLASILWPLTNILRKFLPNALAAAISVLGLLAAVVAIGWATVLLSADGVRDLVNQTVANVQEFAVFAAGLELPFEIPDISALLDSALIWLQDNANNITTTVTTTVTSGLGTLGTVAVAVLLTLVLTFFCLKDGDRFSGWLLRWTTGTVFVHAAEVSARSWHTLSSYILAQAAVALVDAIFIGLGLWFLDVPLALPLAVLIFFAGFLPVIGAVITGLLATFVALLANGWGTALAVLAIVLVVQQLESNVLQPILVGKSLKLHPAVVLTGVTAGGTIFGIIGAFLATPIIAVVMVSFQYAREQMLEAPEDPPNEPRNEPVPPGAPAPAPAE